jgi:CRP/FNR family transcriptional regulator, cyclic AMP receptor protein
MNMTQLRNVSLFSGLTDQQCEIIGGCAAARNFPRGARIINEGDDTHSLYLIAEGRVRVSSSNEDGREFVLSTQGPGEYFGELSLLDDAPRSASVTALEACRLFVITDACFRKCMLDHPNLAVAVAKDLARRVRRLTMIVRDIATLDVYGRLVRVLMDLAVEKDGRNIIDQRLTHQDLANMVGASREMITRILKDLTEGGYIEVEDRHIVIKRPLPQHW